MKKKKQVVFYVTTKMLWLFYVMGLLLLWSQQLTCNDFCFS